MAINYDIDQEQQIVYIVIYDHISITDIQDILIEIQQDKRCGTEMAVLIDAREVKRAFFVRELDNLMQIFANAAAKFISRFALVLTPDLASNLGKRFLVEVRRADLNLSLFRDHAAAVKWLQLET